MKAGAISSSASSDAAVMTVMDLVADMAADKIAEHDSDPASSFGHLSYFSDACDGVVSSQDHGASASDDDSLARRKRPLRLETLRLQSLWVCEICGTSFNSSQALGGHRINSINHKQLLQVLKDGNLEQVLQAVTRLRPPPGYRSDVTAGQSAKRARLSPMGKMPGYSRVVEGFPESVRTALAKTQSPASFFSSCSLQLFRRHSKFGQLVDVDLTQVGVGLSAEEVQELRVFGRMLDTKKKFLDINRKAVSRRISRIRKVDGDTPGDPGDDEAGASARGDTQDREACSDESTTEEGVACPDEGE